MTDLKVSEIFTSLQGEGPSAGTPCLFVRLALCNLHCRWCDTKYTWDWQNFRYEDEVRRLPADRIVEEITAAPSKRVVITGGEPLLQQEALAGVLARVPADVFVEIETNGTQLPVQQLLERVNQWNVSVKLSSAGDPERLRVKPEVLSALSELAHAFLKLVVESEQDLGEADALIARFGWPRARVVFMPEASSRKELEQRSPRIARACRERGVRFTTRLHLTLFDGQRGT